MRGEAGAVFAGLQRAETGGERLRQHRHHAVGEIGGVAALPRGLIEGAARPHEMGHVGDGDDRTPAARIVRRGIGLGPDRVVEIAGVRAVDGHQGEPAQVRPRVETRRRHVLGLRQRLVGEVDRQAVAVDGGQTDRARRVRVAQPLHHSGIGQAEAAALSGLAHHQLTGAGAGGLLRPYREIAAQATVGRFDRTAALPVGVEDPDHPAGARIEHAHGACLVVTVGPRSEPCEHAVAHPRLAHAAGRGVERDRRRRIG